MYWRVLLRIINLMYGTAPVLRIMLAVFWGNDLLSFHSWEKRMIAGFVPTVVENAFIDSAVTADSFLLSITGGNAPK